MLKLLLLSSSCIIINIIITHCAAAMALDKPISALERHFRYLTPSSLRALDDDDDASSFGRDGGERIARAVMRRTVHRCLQGKFDNVYSDEVMEEALRHHTLPTELQAELRHRYDRDLDDDADAAPTTWWEALEQLNE